MIRNIIFDMVGVLMRFDTESYIEEHHLSELSGMGAAGQRLYFY